MYAPRRLAVSCYVSSRGEAWLSGVWEDALPERDITSGDGTNIMKHDFLGGNNIMQDDVRRRKGIIVLERWYL